jgi:hypothetical protein
VHRSDLSLIEKVVGKIEIGYSNAMECESVLERFGFKLDGV